VTFDAFKASVAEATPPAGLTESLLALWHDARGNWADAHTVAQDIDEAEGAWIHAYLHRKEGDLGNAAYWYRRAGKPVANDPLDEEWARIARALTER
jgi:hypothetical protein